MHVADGARGGDSMTNMHADRLVVGLTPVPTAARVARHRAALKARIISTFISLAILTAIFFFLNPGWSPETMYWIGGFWVLSSAAWLVGTGLALQRAKRELATIDHGPGLVIDAHGVEFLHPGHAAATWQEISALKLTGPHHGAGPRLVMESGGDRVASIPMSFLDASASAIDSAVHARSLGTHHLDARPLDKLV